MPIIQERDRIEAIDFYGPRMTRFELPFRRTFYPMGFPMEIVTNSEAVLNAAEESWCNDGKRFDTEIFRLQVCVAEGGSSECPPRPNCRLQQDILTSIADADNYIVQELTRGLSSIWLTEAAVAHPAYLRYFFLEAATMVQLSTRYATAIHSACVARDGVGILLCGDSGAGKSTLSYSCALAGWTYISDDASYLVHDRDDRMVIGKCDQARFRPSATQFFPELQGMEITQRAEVNKPSIELYTAQFEHLQRSLFANVDYIVFLNRRESSTELLPYSKKLARSFMQQAEWGTPAILERKNAAIDRLLTADVLELRYQDLDWAIKRLEQLVREKR